MPTRLAYGLSALLIGVTALWGIGFSSAEWTDQSNTPMSIAAAPDWAGPTVVLAPLDAGIFGTVTVTATASDDRSDIGSVDLQYAPAAGGTWVSLTTGCTAGSGPSPVTYSCQWDTTTASDGDYLVRAVATDTAAPTPFTSTSASVPTQVANNASVVLAPVATPTRGVVTLSGTLLNAGNGSRSISFEYAVAGSGTWLSTGCGAGTTSDYSCSWDTSALNGAYDLRAVGTRGGTTFYDVQAGVQIDNTAPSASLTVPAGVLSGSVQLSVNASDAHTSVTSVTIDYRRQGDTGWTLCGAPTTAPYTCTVNTTSLQDGTYDFRAIATDAAGNTSPPSTQTRDVNNTAGTVSITLPATNATVSGSVVVAASASSPRGVNSVSMQYRAGSTGSFTQICSTATSPYTCLWDVSGFSNGAYELRAVMTETYGGGVIASSTVAVNVNNSLGSIVITSPMAGSTVRGTAALAATIVPASGKSVASVKFYGPGGDAGPALCTGAVTVPMSYGCSWNSTSVIYNATYQLTAVLTHGDGTKLTTSVVVMVDNVDGSVSITSPAAGYVRGSVNVVASASSNAGVTSVTIETRSTPSGSFSTLCTVTTAPYSCPWNTTGTTYGTREVRAVMTQGSGSPATSAPVAVTVDNRVLGAADVQVNNVLTPGTPAAGDTVTLTYSGLVDLNSIKSGWSGASTSVTLTFKDKGAVSPNTTSDFLDFSANLGRITFPQDYVAANKTVTFTGTMVADSSSPSAAPVTVVTITLGTTSGSADLKTVAVNQNAKQLAWTPSVVATDRFGTACAGAAAMESGTPLDVDF